MRTEQQALRTSLVAILTVSVLGIGFGLVSGSSAILFDGVFSLLDAVLSVISIVIAGLITKFADNTLSTRLQNRFTMGFWHFEPIVLALGGLSMLIVATYALVQSVATLLAGGREMHFGPAIGYAVIVVCITTAVGLVERRANRRIRSELVSLDVKGWLITGAVTGDSSWPSSSASRSRAPAWSG